jgi:hypothetical protein
LHNNDKYLQYVLGAINLDRLSRSLQTNENTVVTKEMLDGILETRDKESGNNSSGKMSDSARMMYC